MSMSPFVPRGRHLRKNLAVSVMLASLLVFASACGSGNDSNSNADPSSPASPSASSSASASPESSPSASPSPETSASPSSSAESSNPYEVAGVNDPAAFDQMFSSLQKAVADNDKEEASKYVLYPLRVNGGKEPLTIQDKDDFVAKFDLIFTDDVKKTLADQKPREMFVNDKGVMAGSGQIWFGATADSEQKYGMIAVNLNV